MTTASLRTTDGHRVAIVDALRTPFAKQATFFHGVSALNLGQMVVNELLAKNDLDPHLIDQVVYGQVIQTPAAPNIAREIVLGTGMPVSTDAYSVSRACATSFQTTASACQSILLGDAGVVISGGADSSSVLPIGVSKNLARVLVDLSKCKTLYQRLALLKRLSFKDIVPVPPAIAEYSTGLSMGQTAEQMAKTHQISRADQDDLAHRSHMLASAAWDAGILDSQVMTAHAPPYTSALTQDNNIRFDSDIESYARLRPVFDRKHGSVSAANSTPLTDGASALLMMREDIAQAHGYQPLGYIKSYAFSANTVEEDMLLGPSYATPLALTKAGLTLNDLDLIEMHEAFAAQALVNMDMFASKHFAVHKLGQQQAIGEIDMSKFNVNGGSLAYGHPFAATGGRLLMQTLHELQRRGGGIGLTTACAAGGLGAAMIVETE